jgi:Tubulin-tyrosine ligase family
VKINPADVFARIEDVVIKTIISMESIVFQATSAHVPNRNNCFDLFGFDILLDKNLKPWLLEVNLSPSLACDSVLDSKIKSELIADLFNLVGIVPLSQRTHSHLNKFGEPHNYFKHPSALSPFEFKKKTMSIIIPEARTFENMTREEKNIIYETNEEWGR